MKDEKKKKKEVEVKIDLFSLEEERVNESQMNRIRGGMCGTTGNGCPVDPITGKDYTSIGTVGN